jgi:hypothetical protein
MIKKGSFTIKVSKELLRFIFKDSKVSSASTEFLDLIYQFIQLCRFYDPT